MREGEKNSRVATGTKKSFMKLRRHVLPSYVPVKFSFKLERADIVAKHSSVLSEVYRVFL